MLGNSVSQNFWKTQKVLFVCLFFVCVFHCHPHPLPPLLHSQLPLAQLIPPARQSLSVLVRGLALIELNWLLTLI